MEINSTLSVVPNISKEERQKMMRSEARYDRKRGLHSVLVGDKGVKFRYMIARRDFWKKTMSLERYSLMHGVFNL